MPLDATSPIARLLRAVSLCVLGLAIGVATIGQSPAGPSLSTTSLPAAPDVARLDAQSTGTPVTVTMPAAVEAAPVAVAPTRSFNTEAETWAVVVGANNYHGRAQTLQGAVADATATIDALELVFGVDEAHRRTLIGNQLTRSSLTEALAWLVDNAGPDDNAVFFFAGHIRHVDADTQKLILPDGALVADVELAAMLADLQAGSAWFPIAGCYSGGFDELLGPGRILTAASAADELSYENINLGRSYFGHYIMVEAFLGGHATTVEGAVAYANARLAAEYPNRLVHQFDQHDGDFARR